MRNLSIIRHMGAVALTWLALSCADEQVVGVNTATVSATDLETVEVESEVSSDIQGEGIGFGLVAANTVTTLKARHSGKCLAVVDSSMNVGARIVQQSCNGSAAQNWKVIPVSGDQSQIVSAMSGMCLDVGAASQVDGAIMQQAPCQATWRHQLWYTVNQASGDSSFRSVNSGKCLDVYNRLTNENADVTQWTCSNQDNQSWQASSGSTTSSGGGGSVGSTTGSSAPSSGMGPVPLNTPTVLKVRHSGKCLAIIDGSMNVGARIVQQSCNGSAAQTWKVVPVAGDQSHIVSALSNLCLDIGAASHLDGAIIQQAPCESTWRHQLWYTVNYPSGDSSFRSVNSEKCLDVYNQQTGENAEVTQWTCNAAANQLWQAASSTTASPASPAPAPAPAPSTGAYEIGSGAPISCTQTPTMSALADAQWSVATYGGNHWYSNFFTPLAHYNGSTYWITTNNDGTVILSKLTNGVKTTEQLAYGYRARIDAHSIFSLGFDSQGYIHVAGDMQNGPNDRYDGSYPSEYIGAPILYWKSKSPESLQNGFTFLGKTAGRAIPAEAVNGIRFFNDNYGVLYASAGVRAVKLPTNAAGMKGVGLYRYNIGSQSWQALGGLAPEFTSYPRQPVILWDKGGLQGGGWFQGTFSHFKFDAANRLHFSSNFNIGTQTDYSERLVYAMSPDGGNTWRKANGTSIGGLPIRVRDGVANQGDIVAQSQYAWQAAVNVDGNGRPMVWTRHVNGSDLWYAWNGGWGASWTISGDQPHSVNVAPGGKMIRTRNIAPLHIHCQQSFDRVGGKHVLPGYDRFTNIDERTLRTTGVLYGVGINEASGRQAIVRITFKPQ